MSVTETLIQTCNALDAARVAAHRDATEHAVLAALKTVARGDHYRVAYAGGREHGLTGAPLDAYADEFVTVARRVADKAAA